jgi:putative hydrolase of the HAD superfamily
MHAPHDPLSAAFTATRVVVLDAEGTLFTLAEPMGVTYARVIQSFGVSLDSSVLQRSLEKTWRSFQARYLRVDDAYRTSDVEERRTWLAFARAAVEHACETRGPSVRVTDEMVHAIYDRFAEGDTRRIREGVDEFLTTARSAGLSLVVLSNNDSRLFRVLDDLNLSRYFDRVFPTSKIGFKKPSPQCFARVTSSLGVAPEEILSLGDDLQNDYFAPKAAGWRAILLGETTDPAVLSVSRLAELHRPLLDH